MTLVGCGPANGGIPIVTEVTAGIEAETIVVPGTIKTDDAETGTIGAAGGAIEDNIG